MEPELRKMEAFDILQISEMERRYFSQPWSAESLQKAASDSNYVIYVCSENGNILGYCGLLCMGPEADIVFVCTEEKARRRGIAKMLLSACMEEGKQRGVGDVFLEVREGNTPARTLYQSFGFCETGIRKNYYDQPKENAVLMHDVLS